MLKVGHLANISYRLTFRGRKPLLAFLKQKYVVRAGHSNIVTNIRRGSYSPAVFLRK